MVRPHQYVNKEVCHCDTKIEPFKEQHEEKRYPCQGSFVKLYKEIVEHLQTNTARKENQWAAGDTFRGDVNAA